MHPAPEASQGPSAAVPPLRLVFWETTQACNLACKHCRAEAKTWAHPDELTTAEAMRMMDSWPALGNPVLVFSGGEPLMRHDIFELMGEARRRGIPFALSTNGTLVDARMADRIAELKPHRVSVSLDGADAATHDGFRQQEGAFDRTVNAIRLLHARGIDTQINTSATAHNAGQLPAMLELAVREGCAAWHLFMLVPVGCGLEIPDANRLPAAEYEKTLVWFVKAQASTAIEMKATCAPHVTRVARQYMDKLGLKPLVAGHGQAAGHPGMAGGHPGPAMGHPGASHPSAAKGKGCLAGTGICFISRFGQVQGCGYMPVPAGKLREQPLSEIWRSSPFFNKLRDASNLEGKCGACEFADTCMGCRARAYSVAGNPFAEEPLCAYVPRSMRGIPAAEAGRG